VALKGEIGKAMSKEKRSTFAAVLGSVLIGYGLFVAIIKGSFSGAFVWLHVGCGVLSLLLWFLKGGAYAVKESKSVTALKRRVRGALHVCFDVLVVLLILVCINIIANRYDRRLDTTEAKVNSLVPETVQVIDQIRHPVHITAVIGPNDRAERESTGNLLELYRRQKRDFITYEIIDPRKNPHRVEKELKLKAGETLAIEYRRDGQTDIARATGASENVITNALVKLISGEAKKLYYVVGHGEPRLDKSTPEGMKGVYEALTELGYNVSTIVLAEHSEIPKDGVGVLFVAPQYPILPNETEILKRYLEDGGGVVVLADPDVSEELRSFTTEFGIEIGRDVILDKMQGLQGAPEVGWQIVAREYGYHPITQHLGNGDYTVYLTASTVSLMEPEKRKPTSEYTPLVLTKSITAWAETDLALLFSEKPQALLDPQSDKLPPLAIAVAYEHRISEKRGSRMVVFGDSNWVRNANLNIYGNKNLFLNTVNWVTQEKNTLVIPTREMRQNNQLISQGDFNKMVVMGLLLSEVILIMGLAICRRRKRF
jgi:ABC-type uncharacterized transport system involved in gliding motility auxiliary subunit